MPAVSVLLPVRDALPYLDASLRSLARQTHADFEIVAVDDGSSDGSGERLEQWAAREPRLRVFHTPPLGLPAALNLALHESRAPLLARHDADDLSHRHRLALQSETLRKHPELAVLGARLRLFPGAQSGVGMRRWAAWHNALLEHDAMHAERYIDSPLAHGTAMLRREPLERIGGWSERGWAEDLDLWMRLFDAGARFAKLRQVLYGWRQHRRSATRRDPRYRRDRFVALKLDALERGPLAGRDALTLVGVGASLERCVPVFRARRRVNIVQAGRPSAVALHALVPPVVLVFVAPRMRTQWRETLVKSRLREGSDFVFIA